MYHVRMKILLIVFTLISSLLCSFVQAGTLSGTVVRITDGDTLVVLDANKAQYKIRLMGIDAPESNQAYGKESKDNLSYLVAGKFVVVEYDKLDRYKKIIGKILLSGNDVNLEQVASGMAWHYKNYQGEQSQADQMEYSEAEIDARNTKRGLWNDPDPIPPWDFRKLKRN